MPMRGNFTNRQRSMHTDRLSISLVSFSLAVSSYTAKAT